MNWRVIILVLLVTGSGGAAYYLLATKPPPQQPHSKVVLRGLSDDASTISEVVVSHPTGVHFSARLIDGQWQATHLANNQFFPVEQARLQTLVEQISQARILERKTSKPDYYERLGVAPLDDSAADSRQVSFTAATSRYSLLVGNASEHGTGQFVREKDTAQVVLIDRVISLPRTSTDWLRQDIVPFTADEVTQISITRGEDAAMTLSRDSTLQWRWEQQPETRTLRYPSVLNDIVVNMMAINYDAVSAYSPEKWEEDAALSNITFMLSDGRQIEAWLTSENASGNHHLRIVAGSPAWLSNWVFTLSPYHANALTPTAENLLKAQAIEPTTPES